MSRAIYCLGQRGALNFMRPFPGLLSSRPTNELSANTIIRPDKRTIFTANAIGVSKFDQLRSQKEQMFVGEARERYLERLRDYVQKGDTASIYRDDLVSLIAIAQSEQDLDLLEQILEKSSAEQMNFFYGWGAAIMRLYYKMNQIERATRNIYDEKRFREFFNMRSCYKVVMTMLYDHGNFKKVVELAKLSQERLNKSSSSVSFKERTGRELFPDRDLVILMLSALAKINTPEAFKEAKTFLDRYMNGGMIIGMRPASLVAYMALKNRDPNYALNLISILPSRKYVSLRDIKILALLQLARYDDVLVQLREYAATSNLSQNQLLKSTYEELDRSRENIPDLVIRQDLEDLLMEIRDGKHVSETTIEDLIFRPIDHERQVVKQRDDMEGARSERREYRDEPRERRPRQSRNYSSDRYESHYLDDDSYQPRKEYRGRQEGEGRGANGSRDHRKFSFQNANFES